MLTEETVKGCMAGVYGNSVLSAQFSYNCSNKKSVDFLKVHISSGNFTRLKCQFYWLKFLYITYMGGKKI